MPSPTFTLVQSYDTRVPVHHFDLYRLSLAVRTRRTRLRRGAGDGAALVEWPERAGDRLPGGAVVVELTHEGEGRLARISGAGAAFERIARSLAMRDFLTGPAGARRARRYFTGDASARSYETVDAAGR